MRDTPNRECHIFINLEVPADRLHVEADLVAFDRVVQARLDFLKENEDVFSFGGVGVVLQE